MVLRYELVIHGYGTEEFTDYNELETRRLLWTQANYRTTIKVIYVDLENFAMYTNEM
jgi:hypothetical protein